MARPTESMAEIIAPHCLVPLSDSAVERFRSRAGDIRREGGIPLLSSERFAGNPMSGGHDSKLIAERLKAIFEKATILVVIRRQAEMVVSSSSSMCGNVGRARSRRSYARPGTRRSRFSIWSISDTTGS